MTSRELTGECLDEPQGDSGRNTIVTIELPADLNHPVTFTITPNRSEPESALPSNSPPTEGDEA